MKSYLKNHTTICHLLCLALTASLALPLPSLAASISLASSPLATTTTSSVKPNVTFVLDNSGSMSWEHMPDDATDSGSSVTFSYGYYGLRSSQCNQVYYNPAVTYLAPVYATGTSYADASFAAALPDGYLAAGATIVSAAGDHNYTNTAVNLSSGFKASLPASYTTVAGDTLAQSAYYYTYSGAQTTSALKDYNSTTNTFYTECHDSTGGSVSAIAPVSGVGGVFTKVRLASTETTTITVSAGTSTSVSGITVNGVQLMSAASTASATNTTVATNIAARITLNGFSATAAGAVVTITGPTSAANYPPIITKAAGTGTMTFTPDVFPDTTASKLTNFANWYSYYRTRMLMMKTAAGRAFKDINQNYRVGFMAMNTNASFLNVDTFWNNTNAALGALSTQKTDWYAKLYGSSPTGSTPLRVALANAGRLYANKLTMTGITINDPIQYSCQQNFTILSTDGFWNGNGGVQLDGSSAVGNQDGGAGRPMYDGATANTTVTTTYTQNNYSASGTGCSGSNKRLKTQPRIETCAVVTTGGVAGAENCGSGWSNNGAATYTGACAASVSLPSPNPSTRVQSGSAVTTAGYTGGTSDSLADVAMYYYQTDLRTSDLSNCTGALGAGTDVCTNNVFMSSADSNVQQHMTTFTLGLGATGRMKYTSSYKNDTAATNPGSDYLAVALGSTAAPAANPAICSWQTAGTTCNWPTPGDGLIENIDDLWHAAVNGHGTYFSATDPTSLSTGLSSALAGINALQGSAAAAATSTLNPVAGNNFSYVASYTTVTWKGNLESRSINTVTGVVDETATWCVENTVAGNCPSPGTIVAETSGSSTIYNCVTPNAASCSGGVMSGTDCKVEVAVACTGTMPAKVAAATDTRTIKMAGGAAASGLQDFTYANLSATQQAYYSNAFQTSYLVNNGTLTAATGDTLVNFLRGQNGNEDRSANTNKLYRYREAVLGDALESQPAYISKPVFSYPYAGYSAYVTAQTNRAGMVYMGANDGMLHAFASADGVESWAYVPSMVIPNMWKLADKNYATSHANFVNGSPIISDIYCTANCGGPGGAASWRTILVGGLNGGGRGYYALDITVPTAPTLLWEFTPATNPTGTTGLNLGTVTDDDLGYSYGQAIITQKTNGTWVVVVTSGYNNTSPGDGKGYLYVLDARTGTVLSKIGTTVGDTTTPSGLAKIAGWNNESAGNKVGYIYGGDLLGNVWRFDINTAAAPLQFAILKDPSNNTQPITTPPTLGKIGGKRVIFVGTGKYLETSDLTSTQVQSMYAIKDDDAVATLTNPGGNPRNSTTLVQQTLTNPSSSRTASANAVDFTTRRGWYVDFPDTGERINIDSKLVQGTLIVPSIVPSNTICSPGGYGWLNFFNYNTGGAVNPATSTTASLKYDHTIVGVNVLYIAGQPIVEIVTDNQPTPNINTGVGFAATAAGFTGKRVIWRELIR